MSKVEAPVVRRSRRVAGLAVAALALALAGCGDDDAGAGDGGSAATAPGAGEPFVVIAEDIDFPHDRYEVGAGEIEIVYENEGRIVHTLVIDGVDGFKLAVNSNGDVDEGTVELEAGEYEMYCDIPGHQSAGMEAQLVVS